MLSALCSSALASKPKSKKPTLCLNQSWTSIDLCFLVLHSGLDATAEEQCAERSRSENNHFLWSRSVCIKYFWEETWVHVCSMPFHTGFLKKQPSTKKFQHAPEAPGPTVSMLLLITSQWPEQEWLFFVEGSAKRCCHTTLKLGDQGCLTVLPRVQVGWLFFWRTRYEWNSSAKQTSFLRSGTFPLKQIFCRKMMVRLNFITDVLHLFTYCFSTRFFFGFLFQELACLQGNSFEEVRSLC